MSTYSPRSMHTPPHPSHHPPLPPKRKHSPRSPTPAGRSVRFKSALTEERAFRRSSLEASGDEYEEEEVDEAMKGGGLEGRGVIQRVLSIHSGSGTKVAAAYYDSASKRLHVLEDTDDTVGWDLAVLVMEQWSPEMIIVSSKTKEALVDKVEEYCTQHGIVCELQPSKPFSPGQASVTLSKLHLAGNVPAVQQDPLPTPPRSEDHHEVTDQFARYRDHGQGGMGKVRMSLVRLGCWVNVDAPLAMSAAGGLLQYLSKSASGDNVYAERVEIEVERIESMQLDQFMQINMDALTSLAIFDHEPHTLVYSKKEKEALSIYTLLKSTVTYLGAKLLHSWHLRPLINRDEIKSRHDAVEVFTDPINRDTAKDITRSMSKIKNIHAILTKLQRGRGGHKEWRLLAQAVLAIHSIREDLVHMERAKELAITGKIVGILSPEILEFQSTIASTIDFEMSLQEERVCILPGVDGELDALRREYENLAPVLDEVARRIISTTGLQYGVSLDVQYFPQMGFFIAIRQEQGKFVPPDNWHLTFSSEDAQYYKNKQMQRLDQEIGDIDSNIMSREIEIEQTLVAILPRVEAEMKEMTEIIAELDCLMALARAAERYSLVRPVMVDEPLLEIHHGRHLLQENWVDQYIANDTMMCGGPDGDSHSMMIVTGANGSGKSAYGKQVALIVFMAQIGSFVPAESATIGIVDKIFTRMQTRESSSKDSSAFMIDLAQVSLALRGATSRSLIVLDEFGKGTVACDGAGLLAGVIEYCLNGPCPRTIILTHFHELFTEQFVDDSLPILHCHMKTELVEGSKDLVYLYRLTPGKSLTSSAAACALAHGLPPRIVKRAQEVSELVARFEIARLHDARLTPEDVKELQQAELLARRFLQWDIDPKTQDVIDVLRDMVEEALDPEDEAERESVEGGQNSDVEEAVSKVEHE